LVTVLSAAIFVFVGVDCNHFRYVLDLLVEVRSDQLVTVLRAAIFVFVGVDCNHFRYVLDLLVEVRSDLLVTALRAANFVLLALIVTTSVTYWISKSLCKVWVGDVPGGTADYSERF
jgi:hypothetical protein